LRQLSSVFLRRMQYKYAVNGTNMLYYCSQKSAECQ